MGRLFQLCFVSFLIIIPQLVFGDDFQIRVLIGDDIDPPTVPVLVTAVPLSVDQIDISWLSSTDNVIVSGYRVYRDGVIIATTTLTSYSDTGLLENTLYSYAIDAFDYSNNFSSTSLSVSTTTLLSPIVVATSSQIDNVTRTKVPTEGKTLVTISTTPRTALVTMSHNDPFRYIIRWGRTGSYELGAISAGTLKEMQTSHLTDLEPGTKYQLQIAFFDRFGRLFYTYQNTFITDGVFKTDGLLNVSNLRGFVTGEGDARLSWTNPNQGFEKIRVVRNHLFYPTNITDGSPVYEGRGESFVDVGVFNKRSPYYYTVFVIDESGAVSSGATIYLKQNNSENISTSSASEPVINDPKEVIQLSPQTIFIIQDNKTIAFDSIKSLKVKTPSVISIPVQSLPNHLKVILVTIYDPSDHGRTAVYQLKLSGDGNFYQATVMTPANAGEAPITIEVYDFNAEKIRTIKRVMSYVYNDETSEFITTKISPQKAILFLITGILIVTILGWWIVFFWRR